MSTEYFDTIVIEGGQASTPASTGTIPNFHPANVELVFEIVIDAGGRSRTDTRVTPH